MERKKLESVYEMEERQIKTAKFGKGTEMFDLFSKKWKNEKENEFRER